MDDKNPEIWTIADVKQMLFCVLILAVTALVINGIMLESSIAVAFEEIPGRLDQRVLSVDNHLTGQIQTAIGDLNDRAMQSLDMVDRQLTGTRTDLKGEIEGLRGDLTGTVLIHLDRQLDVLSDNLNSQATTFNGTLAATGLAVTQTANTYTVLPGLLGARLAPAYDALEPEMTCRRTLPDGSTVGYGTCWHSAVTGLLQEGKNVGGVFTQRFPQMADDLSAIEHDSRKVADKFVEPPKWYERVLAQESIAARIGLALTGN